MNINTGENGEAKASAEGGLMAAIRQGKKALRNGEGSEAALAELLEWVDLNVNPNEASLVEQMDKAPEDFLAMPVQLGLHPQMGGGIAETPKGEVAFFNFQLVVPVANLQAPSTVLLAGGQRSNPAEGMLPVLQGRWVLPRGRVRPHVLDALGLKGRAARKGPKLEA